MAPAQTQRHLLAWLAGVALLMAGTLPAEGAIRSRRLLAAILRETPEAVLVPPGEQLKRAQEAAETIPGAGAFIGVGDSMEPLFASNTALVVAPIAFEDLRKGMTVVYVNRRGRQVAHPLKGDLPGGWITQGVNCKREDDDLVTRFNLVGVVVQAFAEAPSDWRTAMQREFDRKRRDGPS